MSQLLPAARSDVPAIAPASPAAPPEPAAAVTTVPGARTAVVGLGYVGLPTSLALVGSGARVIGVDISPDRLDDIRADRANLLDDDRDRLRETLRAADPALRLTTAIGEIADADTVLICVPTPVDEPPRPGPHRAPRRLRGGRRPRPPRPDHHADLTSYVGTTRDLLVAPLAARGLAGRRDVFVAFAPERIDPGNDRHRQERRPAGRRRERPRTAPRGPRAVARPDRRPRAPVSARPRPPR